MPALVLAPAGAAHAETGSPEGEGDATALHVEGVVTVSDCHAENGQANCTALSVLGNEVAGSNQEGAGSSGNTGIGGEDPSGNGGGSLYLFGSESNVNEDGSSSSESSAASADVGGVVQVKVLHARADSDGNAESNGVYLNVGGTEVHVLHAASSDGKGRAAAAKVGDTWIVDSGEDDGVACPLDGDPAVVADLICAEGRRAGVVDDASAAGGGVTGEVVTVNSRNAEDAEAGGPDGLLPPSAAGGAPEDVPPLARTGTNALMLLLAGAASVVAGEGARRRATS